MEELLESEHPAALILELRELKYSWGDEMARTLSVPSTWFGGEFPVAVVTSELNQAGLTSLVRDEMSSDPAEWLTNSEEEAIALLESKFQKVKSSPNNAIQLPLRTTAVCLGHLGDVILMSGLAYFEQGN